MVAETRQRHHDAIAYSLEAAVAIWGLGGRTPHLAECVRLDHPAAADADIDRHHRRAGLLADRVKELWLDAWRRRGWDDAYLETGPREAGGERLHPVLAAEFPGYPASVIEYALLAGHYFTIQPWNRQPNG